jgi:hypothetical protein
MCEYYGQIFVQLSHLPIYATRSDNLPFFISSPLLDYQVTTRVNRVIEKKWSNYEVARYDYPKHVISHRNDPLNVKQMFCNPESNILVIGKSVLLKLSFERTVE